MAHILLINGPNINLQGTREQNIYGHTTMEQINKQLLAMCQPRHQLTAYQSNSEAQIIDWIQQSLTAKYDFLILNPAALGHYSISLRDALQCLPFPFIEVHLSNTLAREKYRQQSYTSDLAIGVIMGLKEHSYYLAMNYALQHLEK